MADPYTAHESKTGTQLHSASSGKAYEDGLAPITSTIEAKYAGTAVDRREMAALGRVQELRRNFQFMSVLGFGCTLIGTWNYFLGLIQFGLTDGGTAGLIYGFVVTLVGFSCVYLSLAEMASMSPTAGGQYHWVSEFAPKRAQKYLSYISGYLVAAGWQGSTAGTAFLTGTIIQGMISLNYPDSYTARPYQGTLLAIAVMVFCILFNVFLAKRLPFVEGVLLVIYMIGFFAIVITLWVVAPIGNAQAVFSTFNNAGGWSSVGVAVMVGMGGVVPSMAGFDCAVHMAEEIKDASTTLPKAILFGVVVNGIMGMVMVITLCFTLGDVNSILGTKFGFPFIQVFYNATNSVAGTNTLVALVVIVFVSAVISEIATSSRQLWSFARDGGLPGSPWIAKIRPGANIPLNAIWISLGLAIIVALINLGSTTALNAINSVTVSALLSSYMLTIGCLLYRRFAGDPLPARRWSLGSAGAVINIASMIFLTPLFVFAFFPLSVNPTPTDMNWGIAMFGGMIIVASVYYAVQGRKEYRAPVTLVKLEHYEM